MQRFSIKLFSVGCEDALYCQKIEKEDELTRILSLNKINNLNSWTISGLFISIFYDHFLLIFSGYDPMGNNRELPCIFISISLNLWSQWIVCHIFFQFLCEFEGICNDCINMIIITPIMTQSIRFMSPIFATPHHHCFVCHKGA